MKTSQLRAMYAKKGRNTITKKQLLNYDKVHHIKHISSNTLRRKIIAGERPRHSLKKSKEIAGAVLGKLHRKRVKEIRGR